MPDLRGASLRNCHLGGALLNDVILAGADLSFSDLRRADLKRSDLRGVLLTGSDLRQADLGSVVLADIVDGIGNSVVDITNADFTEAIFGWTLVGDIFLNRMIGIGQIRHAGPSYLSTSTLEFTVAEIAQSGTFRTDIEAFLRGAGVLLDSFSQFEQSLRSHAFYSAFISYSHADQGFATWLHAELQTRGIRCWLDEKNMRPGERILDAVAKAIGSHDKILLCCSRSSLES
jgi:TIR domain/Pentapeptide repeats (8 copies)